MRNHIATLVAGVLIGLVVVTASNGLLAAQGSTPTTSGAARGDETTMMQMGTPSATDAEMAAKMDEMVDQCLAMMKMMSSMMGMMSGQDMQGMEGMQGMMGMAASPEATATPGA